MSRGPITTYINTNADTSTITNMQKGDIAIVKYSSLAPTAASAETSARAAWQTEVYQYNGTTWVASRTPEFTDPTIIPNVTKIRLAHIEETRAFLRYIQDIYANRFGDTYYNGHDYTHAVMQWGPSDTNIARLYLGDYGAGSKWLTVEFSDSITDRVRFLYKDAARVSSTVLDIMGNLLDSYVPVKFRSTLLVEGATTLQSALTVNSTAHITGGVDIDSTLNVDGNTTLLGATTLIKGNTTINENAGYTTTINGATNFKNNVDIDGTLNVDGFMTATSIQASGTISSTAADGNAPMTITSTTVVTNLNSDMTDGKHVNHLSGGIPWSEPLVVNVGLDADTLDGKHLAEVLAQTTATVWDGTNYVMKQYSTRKAGEAKVYSSTTSIIGRSLKVVFDYAGNPTTKYIPCSDLADGTGAETCTCTCTCTGPCCDGKWC